MFHLQYLKAVTKNPAISSNWLGLDFGVQCHGGEGEGEGEERRGELKAQEHTHLGVASQKEHCYLCCQAYALSIMARGGLATFQAVV